MTSADVMVDTSRERRRALTMQRVGVYATYTLSFFTLVLAWHIMATYVTPSLLFSPPLAVFAKAFCGLGEI